uniref:Cilia- and flagella-associated protein 157 n=1 Tax=Palpitomonas bilix TaxID=652834 RepID=A0A7S3D8H8_9EUKA|mmetsp:Transcript_24683/g.62485  ORF Transcript_24683/g.62485 Transcript_24683/m.62485 type:complete len:469 (+) Transcript_24683:149-1555(+)
MGDACARSPTEGKVNKGDAIEGNELGFSTSEVEAQLTVPPSVTSSPEEQQINTNEESLLEPSESGTGNLHNEAASAQQELMSRRDKLEQALSNANEGFMTSQASLHSLSDLAAFYRRRAADFDVLRERLRRELSALDEDLKAEGLTNFGDSKQSRNKADVRSSSAALEGRTLHDLVQELEVWKETATVAKLEAEKWERVGRQLQAENAALRKQSLNEKEGIFNSISAEAQRAHSDLLLKVQDLSAFRSMLETSLVSERSTVMEDILSSLNKREAKQKVNVEETELAGSTTTRTTPDVRKSVSQQAVDPPTISTAILWELVKSDPSIARMEQFFHPLSAVSNHSQLDARMRGVGEKQDNYAVSEIMRTVRGRLERIEKRGIGPRAPIYYSTSQSMEDAEKGLPESTTSNKLWRPLPVPPPTLKSAGGKQMRTRPRPKHVEQIEASPLSVRCLLGHMLKGERGTREGEVI